MDIENIPKDYCKQASRDLSVFASSIFGETYVKTFRELFDIDFPSILWVVRNGNFMTFYRSEKDHQDLRRKLGEKLTDKKFAKKVVSRLREYTDWFNMFIKENQTLDEFNRKKQEFVENYRKFFAYHQAVYWGGDYLAENFPEMEDTIEELKEVYAYNERVVPDIEEYLSGLGIDHLSHYEEERDKEDVGLFFIQDKDTVKFYGNDLDEIEEYIINLSEKSSKSNYLKGLTVYPGNVTGEVQVIKDPNKLYMAREGVILVTGMTRPQFNHILSKCKGIITNEGNILSHAAILCREEKIPCIVRTGKATEVLKDGDIVQIDGGNSVVKVLSCQ